MKLHTLPDILFPNPIQHPNYKIPLLMKVKEELNNVIAITIYRISFILNHRDLVGNR